MTQKNNALGIQRILFSTFVIFLMFNTSIAEAFAQSTPSSTTSSTSPPISPSSPGATPSSSTTLSPFGSCNLSALTPDEIQALKNALFVDGNGFIGSQIGSGAPANSDRAKVSDDNKLVVPNLDDNKFAFQQEVPVSKISPNELPIRGHVSHGAFAFGIIADDTVRAARCKDPKNPGTCAATGNALTLRNSDGDTLPEVRNVWKDISPFSDTKGQLSESDAAAVQLMLEDQSLTAKPGEENIPINTYARKPNVNLVNGISVNDGTFSASLETPCANSKCNIALYSMFDKYFNSWFSTEMVVSFTGPVLLGQLKKMAKLSGVLSSDTTIGKFLGSVAKIPTNPLDLFFEKNVKTPSDAFGGSKTIMSWRRKYIEDADLGAVYKKLYAGDKEILSNAKSSGARSEEFAEKGIFGSITDFTRRKKLVTFTDDAAKYMDVANTVKNASKADSIKKLAGLIPEADLAKVVGDTKKFQKALDAGDVGEIVKAPIDVLYTIAESKNKTEADKALIQYGQKLSTIMSDFDDGFSMDLAADIFRTDDRASFGGLFVKPLSGGDPVELKSMENFGKLQDSLIKSGDKPSFFNTPFEKAGTAQSALKIYQFNVDEFIGDVDVGKLARGEYGPKDYLKIGENKIPASIKQLPFVQSEINKGGKVTVVRGSFGPATQKVLGSDGKLIDQEIDFKPIDYVKRLTQADFMGDKVKNAALNTKNLANEFAQKNWAGGNYTSLLSKQAVEEERLIKDYFTTFSGAVKWTAIPYVYVWAKKGFGFENASAFRLPKEYSQLKFEPGQEKIYDDAYVDFFANAGSNIGDLFTRVVNKLPWNSLVIDPAVKNFEPAKNAWDVINNNAGRSKVENLAMFVFGGQDCSGCSLTLSSPNPGILSPSFVSTQNLTSFFIEDPKSKDAIDSGQALALFAHHTNVKGKIQSTQLDEINLVKDQKAEKTCQQMVEKLPLGFGAISKLLGDNPARVAAALAIAEDMTYLAGGYAGILASTTQQLYIAPELNGCTDDKQGYFASLFAPKAEEGRASTELGGNASKNALDGIREFAKTAQKDFNGLSLTDKAVKEVSSKVQEFTDSAQKSNVVSATLRMQSSLINGTVKSPESLFWWFKEGLDKAKYLKEGKTVLSSSDGHTVELNNETGQVLVNGKEVIGKGSADLERLHSINTNIPAVELPTRIGRLSLGDTNQTIFIVTVNGEFLIADPAVQNCLASAVLNQSGLPLTSDHLSDVFGRVETVVTDSYPNVAFDSERKMIIAEGLNRKIENGDSAQVAIGANATVSLHGSQHSSLGNLQSVQFQNGLLVYKPETNELLIWLKHHKNGILNQNDVENFKGTLTNTINSLNSCQEPAIDLAVETDPSTARTKLLGDNFNTSLNKQGPFQTFETDSKIMVLYSKKVDGVCKNFFKVIDKATGKVLVDSEISSIKQLEDGSIQIQAPDGSTHTLKFSQENGVPVLTYDGKAETLQTAQGKNGAFYYDPAKGLYYSENGQFIPLQDNFKKDGVLFSANPDGTVSGKPSSNFLIVPPTQGGEGLFNIPSLPLEPLYLAIFMISLLGIFTIIRIRSV